MKKTYGFGMFRRLLAAALAAVFVVTAMPAVHAVPAAEPTASGATLVGKYDFETSTEGPVTDQDTVANAVSGAAALGGGTLHTGGAEGTLEIANDDEHGKVLKFKETSTATTKMTVENALDFTKDFSAAIWFNYQGTTKTMLFQQPDPGKTVLTFHAKEKKLGTNIYTGKEKNPDGNKTYENATGWHHAAITFAVATKTLTFYYDGENAGTTQGALADNMETAKQLIIGNHKGSQADGIMNGLLDDIRIYTGVLTAEEVEKIYAGDEAAEPEAQPTSVPLVGQYTFEDLDVGTTVSSATAQNSAPKGEDVTLKQDGTFNDPDSHLSIIADDSDRGFGKVLKFANVEREATMRMQITDGIDFSNDFSISLWFKRDVANKMILLQQPTDNGKSVLLVDAQGKLGTVAINGVQWVDSAYSDATGWHHAVITFDASNDQGTSTMTFYLDGVPGGEKSGTPSDGVKADKTLYIGNHKGTQDDTPMKGSIDDIQIYDGVLTAADVQTIYNQHAPSEPVLPPDPVDPDPVSGLVGHYTFDVDGDGNSTAHNAVTVGAGKLGDATLANVSIESDDNPDFGKVLYYGSSDNPKMTIPDAINASKAFTLAMWVKIDAGVDHRVSLFQQTTKDGKCILGYYNTENQLGTYLSGGDVMSKGTIAKGVWQHVAIKRDPDTKQVTFYINGRPDVTVGVNSVPTVLTDLIVGHHKTDTDVLSGCVDDVRVYNSLLTDSDIWDVYAKQGKQVEFEALQSDLQDAEALLAEASAYSGIEELTRAAEALQSAINAARGIEKDADINDMAEAAKTLNEAAKAVDLALPVALTIDKENVIRDNFDESMFGANHRFAIDAYSTFDPDTGKVRDDFNQLFDEASFGMTRFPGGSCSNLYRWKLSLGPIDERPKQIPSYYYQGTEPYRGDFGIMEALSWGEERGVETSYTYGIAYSSVQDAKDLVEFLNAPVGTNINGGVDWARVRAELGHPEPFNIRYFEIGNETQQTYGDDGTNCQGYWVGYDVNNTTYGLLNSDHSMEKFLYGGDVSITRLAVRYEDWRKDASRTTGEADDKFYLPYANENPRDPENWTELKEDFNAVTAVANVTVDNSPNKAPGGNGTVYTVIDDPVVWAGKSQEDLVVFLDKSDGSLTFGKDGIGKIPAANQYVHVTYTVHHDGFVDIANAIKNTMRQIAPEAECKVYAGWEGNGLPGKLHNTGNDDCYDGIVVHAYAKPATTDDKAFYDGAMAAADSKQGDVDNFVRQVNADQQGKEVVISEFGINRNYPLGRAQANAVYLAKAFLGFMKTNVTYAERHCLVDFYNDSADTLGATCQAVIQAVPVEGQGNSSTGLGKFEYFATPSARVFQLFRGAFGSKLVSSEFSRTHQYINGVDSYEAVASVDDDGTVYAILVNVDRIDGHNIELTLAGEGSFEGATVYIRKLEAGFDESNDTDHDAIKVVNEEGKANSAQTVVVEMEPSSIYAVKIVPAGKSAGKVSCKAVTGSGAPALTLGSGAEEALRGILSDDENYAITTGRNGNITVTSLLVTPTAEQKDSLDDTLTDGEVAGGWFTLKLTQQVGTAKARTATGTDSEVSLTVTVPEMGALNVKTVKLVRVSGKGVETVATDLHVGGTVLLSVTDFTARYAFVCTGGLTYDVQPSESSTNVADTLGESVKEAAKATTFAGEDETEKTVNDVLDVEAEKIVQGLTDKRWQEIQGELGTTNINILAGAYLDITVGADGYKEGGTSYTLDITPRYYVVATTETSAAEADKTNSVKLADDELALTNVQVEITLPANFAKEGQMVYVRHEKDSTYTGCEVKGGKIVYTAPHFSKFIITLEKPGTDPNPNPTPGSGTNPGPGPVVPPTPSTPSTPGGTSPSAKFIDVDQKGWYINSVNYVLERGLMKGVGDTEFAPEDDLTRAELVTVLHRLAGEPAAAAASFTDVKEGQWFADAVAWAAANEIVTGYGNGKFGPDDPVTREQAAAILYRYAKYKNYNIAVTGSLDGYTDAGKINDWAVDAMKWCNSHGIITGETATTLAPRGTATRAEVATILERFCKNIVK